MHLPYYYLMKNIFVFFLFIIFFLSLNLKAENLNVFALGMYDFNKKKNEAIDFRIEKRLDKSLYEIGPESESLYFIKPFYGLEFTSDSAVYALGGIYIEEKISENIFLTPNFGVGIYSNGDGKDLGHAIQFRSTLEFSYKIENNNRIAISIGHISNASLAEKNPGTEIISLSYQSPF